MGLQKNEQGGEQRNTGVSQANRACELLKGSRLCSKNTEAHRRVFEQGGDMT